MHPVQFIQAEQAKPGGIAASPTYDVVACIGCKLRDLCRTRPTDELWHVESVNGNAPEHFCQSSGWTLKAARVRPWRPDTTLQPMRRRERVIRTKRYLLDANVFICARRWKHRASIEILEAAGQRFSLATTKQILNELHHSYQLPRSMEVATPLQIDDRVRQACEANATALGKKASEADMSLIQACVDSDFDGIISHDPDLLNVHVTSLVESICGRAPECVHPNQFAKRISRVATPAIPG